MMHKVKVDIDKKSQPRRSSGSKPSSRRSSIAPTTKTIEEAAEVRGLLSTSLLQADSAASTPRKEAACGLPTALRMVGKTKMDLASKMKAVARKDTERKDSEKSDATSTGSTSPRCRPAPTLPGQLRRNPGRRLAEGEGSRQPLAREAGHRQPRG